VLRTLLAPVRAPRHPTPTLYRDGDDVLADCADGRVLRLLAWDGTWDGSTIALAATLAGTARSL
jgi:hypothetical protein